MDFTVVTFRCPHALLKSLDDEAEIDHRTRTSMLLKIIELHFKQNPPQNGVRSAPKKKAGTK